MLTRIAFFAQRRLPRRRGFLGVAIMTLTKSLAVFCFAGALVAWPAFAQAPQTAPAMKPSMSSSTMTKSAPLVDINTAGKPDLMALKGIGDKRADDIIKGRPYKGKDELVQKKILPEAVYDGVKDKIIAKQK